MNSHLIPEYRAGSPRPLNRIPDAEHSFAVLLVPGFTLVGFASAVEPLRMANMATDASLFSAVTVSIDGEPVAASNGVVLEPDHSIDDLPDVRTVLVCGANPIRYPDPDRLVHWLQTLASGGVELGSIDSGSELLARAGLLDGYRCTIHWQDLGVMLARHPRLIVSDHLFEIDRDRLTSGGGTAVMHMMLELIRRKSNGAEIAAAVADLLVYDRLRRGADQQRVPLQRRLGTGQPALRTAVIIMEANTESPLSIPEIAGHAQLSERQLERLFRQQLNCTPTAYYRELRLHRARRELLNTDAPITEIARRSGFQSASHFARRYAQLFELTPSDERNRAADTPPRSVNVPNVPAP